MSDHRFVERLSAHGSVEAGVAEGEHARRPRPRSSSPCRPMFAAMPTMGELRWPGCASAQPPRQLGVLVVLGPGPQTERAAGRTRHHVVLDDTLLPPLYPAMVIPIDPSGSMVTRAEFCRATAPSPRVATSWADLPSKISRPWVVGTRTSL